MNKTILVTGSAGLVGGEVSVFFASRGYQVIGVDNNLRQSFFGAEGSTDKNRQSLERSLGRNYQHISLDVRSATITYVLRNAKPSVIVHAAGQPSHDRSATFPKTDFDINAMGTVNLLEAARIYCPEAPFIFMSTNKVYGDWPNRVSLTELDLRYDFKKLDGWAEDSGIDTCTHSPFGASKLAADLMVQEYGRYYGMPTVCLRAGCITGAHHAGVPLHGFLNYLVKRNVQGKEYVVYGYKGKQVRDNIHAHDVASFMVEFMSNPKCGAVYNIGGGIENSCSVLEAFALTKKVTGKSQVYRIVDNPRVGDHICYYTDLTKIRNDYPNWKMLYTLPDIIKEIATFYEDNKDRLQ